MIKVNSNEEVVVKFGENEYCLKNTEEYKEFVIMITDPKGTIDESVFEVDENIEDPRLKLICNKYKDFFVDFLIKKKEVLETSENVIDEIISEENE